LWTFDQASNVIMDRSGNGHALTLTGTPTLVRGLHRDVLQLSPTKYLDFFDMSLLPLTSRFTIVFSVAVTASQSGYAKLADFTEFFVGPEHLRLFMTENGGGLASLGVPHVGAPTYFTGETMSYVANSGAWTLHAMWIDCATGDFGTYDMGLMGACDGKEGVSGIPAGWLDGVRNGNQLFIAREYGDSGAQIMTCTLDMLAIYSRKLDLREVLEMSMHKRPPAYYGRTPTSDEGAAAPATANWPIGWYRRNVVSASGQPRGWYNTGTVAVPVWTADINYP
jgi:hypothetical protein